MSRKSKGGLVYSTSEETMRAAAERAMVEEETPLPAEQRLRVSLERKGRKGKSVTIVSGFVGRTSDLIELGKILKTRCGVGGSVKDQEIIIQGEVVTKVVTLLKDLGYVGTRG